MSTIRWVGFSFVLTCVSAAAAFGQVTKPITGFEEFADGDEVIWQEPSATTTTRGILIGTDFNGAAWDVSQVVPWAMFSGSKSYEIYFLWEDPANPSGLDGVRATTTGSDNLQCPSIHLRGTVEFKMAVVAYEYDEVGNTLGAQIPAGNASILMCMGARETGRAYPLGETDLGTGDIEYVYLPDSEVIPTADSNGMIPWPPGGKRYSVTGTWPPPSGDWQTVTFDLANPGAIRGFNNDGIPPETAGDGVLDATSNGHGVNRGVLESLFFTNDSTDPNGEIFFIYIDDVVFTAPEDDPVIPPTIVEPIVTDDLTVTVEDASTNATGIRLKVGNGVDPDLTTNGTATGTVVFILPHPAVAGDVYTANQTVGGQQSADSIPVHVTFPGPVIGLLPKEGDVSVRISQIDPNASEVELFVHAASQGTAPTPGGTTTVDVTVLAALVMGQDVTATMMVDGAASDPSDVAIVTTSGVAPAAFCDHFEYADQSAFDGVWQATSGDTQLALSDIWNATPGGSKAALSSAVGDNRSQLITNFADTAGTDTHPIIWSLNFYDDASSYSTYRQYGAMHGGAGAILAMGKYNNTGGDEGTKYSARIVGGAEWFALNDPGAPGVSNGWHTFTAVIKSSTIDYYVDGILSRHGMSRTAGIQFYTARLGSGESSAGGGAWYDDFCLEVGALHFPTIAAQPRDPPTIVEPIVPGDPTVTVTDANTNATEIRLHVDNGVDPDLTTNGTDTGTVIFTLPHPATAGDTYTATQTVDGLESNDSAPVTVLLPGPVLYKAPAHSETVVRVVDVDTNASLVEVKVNDTVRGSVDPAGASAVDVSLTSYTLSMGETVTAKMTVGAVGSVDSDPETVTTDVTTDIVCDDFESYADQAAFEASAWNNTSGDVYQTLTTTENATPGGSQSLFAPVTAQTRVEQVFAETVPTATVPVVLTAAIYDPAGGGSGNQWVDANGDLSTNWWLMQIGMASCCAPSTTYYNLRLNGNGGPDWVDLDEFDGPVRSIGWHQFTVVHKGNFVDAYVDGLLAKKNIPLTSTTTIEVSRIGSGVSAGSDAYYDDYCLTTGPARFEEIAAQPPLPPTVNSPIEVGDTSVTVSDVGPDVTLVNVHANSVPIGNVSDPAGTNGVVNVSVTPLVHLETITADQTNASGTSSQSSPLEVGKGNGDILVCVGIRETGDAGPLGSEGGTTGPIEWVGASSQSSGAPQGEAVSPSSGWITLTFDPGSDPITGFTGNGMIDGTRGTLEHLAVSVNAASAGRSTGAYTMYVDNVINSNADGGPDFLITDFEANSNGDEVLFQEPTNSGTTYPDHLSYPPSASAVTSAQAAGGVRSGVLRWFWKDTTAQRWARITTTETQFLSRPIIDITKPIQMDILLIPDCGSIDGDMDGDGDVELDDYADFRDCLGGPGIPFGVGCECANFNGDRDVDLGDFGGFQRVFGP